MNESVEKEASDSLATSIKDIDLNNKDNVSDGSDKKREAFGNRHLSNEQNVFDFNAW